MRKKSHTRNGGDPNKLSKSVKRQLIFALLACAILAGAIIYNASEDQLLEQLGVETIIGHSGDVEIREHGEVIDKSGKPKIPAKEVIENIPNVLKGR